jgi:hypothetical protein
LVVRKGVAEAIAERLDDARAGVLNGDLQAALGEARATRGARGRTRPQFWEVSHPALKTAGDALRKLSA